MPSLKKSSRRKYLPEKKDKQATSDQTFYNSKMWRKYSRSFRIINPLCAVAMARDEVIGSDVVDHIVPIEQGGSKWDPRNHMAMSHYWHNRKRNLESRGIIVETRRNENNELIPINSNAAINLLHEHWPTGGEVNL